MSASEPDDLMNSAQATQTRFAASLWHASEPRRPVRRDDDRRNTAEVRAAKPILRIVGRGQAGHGASEKIVESQSGRS
jgi:hypothetical protein